MTPSPRHVLVGVAALVLVTAVAAVAAVVLSRGRGSHSYYFSPDGVDTALGTTPGDPWRTLAKLGSVELRAGDRVYLEGGTTFRGQSLSIPASARGTTKEPIVVTTYGAVPATITGADGACLTVAGSRVVVRDLATSGCRYSGIAVTGDYVTIDHVESSGSFAGISIREGGDHAVVRNSYVHDNKSMRPDTPGPDDDSGAFGVLVNGDYALVTHNTISGQAAPSADFGTDGSAVEVFGAEHTVVSYNIARDNHTFTELGARQGVNQADDTTYAYNQVTSTQPGSKFVVTRGGGPFGPVTRTRLVHNTAILSGRGSEGVVCGPACSPGILTSEANLIYAAYRPVSVTGSYTARDNLVAGGTTHCSHNGDRVPCPDRVVGDLRILDTGRFVTLLADSPAIGAARADPRWTRDIAGHQVSDGSGVDVGAWERPAG